MGPSVAICTVKYFVKLATQILVWRLYMAEELDNQKDCYMNYLSSGHAHLPLKQSLNEGQISILAPDDSFFSSVLVF